MAFGRSEALNSIGNSHIPHCEKQGYRCNVIVECPGQILENLQPLFFIKIFIKAFQQVGPPSGWSNDP